MGLLGDFLSLCVTENNLWHFESKNERQVIELDGRVCLRFASSPFGHLGGFQTLYFV